MRDNERRKVEKKELAVFILGLVAGAAAAAGTVFGDARGMKQVVGIASEALVHFTGRLFGRKSKETRS